MALSLKLLSNCKNYTRYNMPFFYKYLGGAGEDAMTPV